MSDLATALERMPHSGAMRLIAGITAVDETAIACRGTDHREASYPLRLDGVLYTATLAELGAQAAAAHASMHGMGAAHTGLVLSLSDVVIHHSHPPEAAPLDVTATRTNLMEQMAGYDFELREGETTLLTGSVLLSLTERRP